MINIIEMKIVDFLKRKGKSSLKEIIDGTIYLGISKEKIKKIISKLISKKYIITTGKGNGTVYIYSSYRDERFNQFIINSNMSSILELEDYYFDENEIKNLENQNLTLKTGNEKILHLGRELDFSLLDFWKWSGSDILSNTLRENLAKFIVATALEIDIKIPHKEWDSYDLTTKCNIKVNVKSSAYIQSWDQNNFSKISFDCSPTKEWNYENNKKSYLLKRQADVYVFCLLKYLDKTNINPLNTDQWEFWIISTSELDHSIKNQKKINFSTLKRICSRVKYSQIQQTIGVKNIQNLI